MKPTEPLFRSVCLTLAALAFAFSIGPRSLAADPAVERITKNILDRLSK